MDWDDLRFVLAVARRGSIAGAARDLGVSHSTVHRRLKAFEDEHDLQMFERDADGARLTDAGETLLAPLRRVEESVLEVERTLSQHEDEIAGEVTIAAPEILALTLCGQLRPLLERHPKLTLHWRLGSDPVSLQRGEAEVALRAAASPPESLVGKKLQVLSFSIFASRVYLEAHSWSTIDCARWVVFDDSLGAAPQARWEREHVPDTAVVMRVNRRVMLDEAVRAGMGVGVLPCAVGDANPSLVRLCEPIADLAVPLWILTHEDLRDVPRVRAVMEACMAAVRN